MRFGKHDPDQDLWSEIPWIMLHHRLTDESHVQSEFSNSFDAYQSDSSEWGHFIAVRDNTKISIEQYFHLVMS